MLYFHLSDVAASLSHLITFCRFKAKSIYRIECMEVEEDGTNASEAADESSTGTWQAA
jgi:hypothetical protein